MERREVIISELDGGYVITKRIRTFNDKEELVSENVNQAVATEVTHAASVATTFLTGD